VNKAKTFRVAEHKVKQNPKRLSGKSVERLGEGLGGGDQSWIKVGARKIASGVIIAGFLGRGS